jgi:hypothetical protein
MGRELTNFFNAEFEDGKGDISSTKFEALDDDDDTGVDELFDE